MIGGGAFNIMSDMGGKAGGLAIIIGWIITAIGMISLAFVFQNLTNERPELDGGIYSYAQSRIWRFCRLYQCLGILVLSIFRQCCLCNTIDVSSW